MPFVYGFHDGRRHAQRSVEQFGGREEDYLPIHDRLDASKAHMPDLRHRALRHHSEGIFLCEAVFGVAMVNSDGVRAGAGDRGTACGG